MFWAGRGGVTVGVEGLYSDSKVTGQRELDPWLCNVSMVEYVATD